MDLVAELESLAYIAQSSEECVEQIEHAVQRWTHLFSYEPEEAEARITEQRSDLVTGLIPEDLWRIAQASGDLSGHNRESYTHFVKKIRNQPRTTSKERVSHPDEEYLLKLGGTIKSAETLQRYAGLDVMPIVHTGVSTEDECAHAQFCLVNSSTKQNVTDWSAKQRKPCPDFILVSIAPKDLCDSSIAPMLGRMATMPQHRMEIDMKIPRPQQNEYPVWYFFYGVRWN